MEKKHVNVNNTLRGARQQGRTFVENFKDRSQSQHGALKEKHHEQARNERGHGLFYYKDKMR